MRLVHWGRAKEFIQRYPQAKSPLVHLRDTLKNARWKSFADINRFFNSADQVGEYTIFDLGGNKFRLVAIVIFEKGAVYVRHVLTHEEYCKRNWKK